MRTGLSYTNFSLSEAQPSAEVAEVAELGVGENTTVSLTVANVGAREGDEVIMALFMPHAGTVPEGAPAARLKQQSAPSLFLRPIDAPVPVAGTVTVFSPLPAA